MKLFECGQCRQLIFFENTICESCGSALGFVVEEMRLAALKQVGQDWRPVKGRAGQWRFCDNREHGTCNWMVPADDPNPLCRACRLNRTIPDLSDPENLDLWRRTEAAKHRLIYTLLRLGLPLKSKAEDPETGFAFDFLAPDPQEGAAMTGHAAGLITINLEEADPAQRERMRQDLSEPYRTMVGHFRHEIGHYYWDLLVRDGGQLKACRALFGDDREDYQAALQQHYANEPVQTDAHISHYAAAHPWEDFAETWAHYLHIVDTLETAQSFGLRLRPKVGRTGKLDLPNRFDPYRAATLAPLIEAWLPLTYAVNSLNDSMGQPDLYPFVLSPQVIEKLQFVHGLIAASR